MEDGCVLVFYVEPINDAQNKNQYLMLSLKKITIYTRTPIYVIGWDHKKKSKSNKI